MAKINQQNIADQLKISRATVSRCFTNHPGINPETRAKVFELATIGGYTYQETKTGGGRSKLTHRRVGVLVCSTEEEYFRQDYESPGEQLMTGVSEFAQLHRMQIDLRLVSPDATINDPAFQLITSPRKRIWDGLLLLYPFPPNIIKELASRFPTVSLVEQYGKADVNCIDVDHSKGIATVIDRLHHFGHRRIGFFTRRYPVEAGWSLHRFSAYCEKLVRSRHPLILDDIVNVFPNDCQTQSPDLDDMTQSHDFVAARVRDGVTAWVCAADHQAYDLIEGLEKRGIRVPQDVSVTGFDGIHQPPGAPKLTTMQIPYREIGLTGGKRLHEIMKKRFHFAQHILVASQLNDGETIATPGNSNRTPKNSDRRRK